MINVITRGKRFLALTGLGLGLVSLMACSQAPLASTRPGTPDNNSGSPAPAVGAPAAQPGLSGGDSGRGSPPGHSTGCSRRCGSGNEPDNHPSERPGYSGPGYSDRVLPNPSQ